MKARTDRITSLSEALAAVLEREQAATVDLVTSLVGSIRAIRRETADRRLQRIDASLSALGERLELFFAMARRDYLAKIERETEVLGEGIPDGRASSVLAGLLDAGPVMLDSFCSLLLDRAIEATGAERGIVLFYEPESTEARIAAARQFATNLSFREHEFSRTLLAGVLRRGTSLLVGDACHDPAFSHEESVQSYQLKSVLAIPLVREGHAIGAIYLENNALPCAFDEDDVSLLETVARFAVFYLLHARLLPGTAERDDRVFLDADMASREIVGRDPKILEILALIAQIANAPATVLIEGESGTGKELVARALHYQSDRRDGPFVAINCAAIPESLLESELFGHERGAFTGASDRYIGKFEQADRGTLFLDEVNELVYPLQAKLLRVLQSSEFQRLGGQRTIRVDVRTIAASSRDLKALSEAGKFQDALYYRINVIPIRLPALRERKDDIPLLMARFVEKYSVLYGRRVRFEPEVCQWLCEYAFPGNVRELENLIHRCVALARDDVVRLGDLPHELLGDELRRVSLAKDPLERLLRTPPADIADARRRRREVRRMLAEQERNLVERSLRETGGNVTEAASRLGVHRVTLHKMVRRSGGGGDIG